MKGWQIAIFPLLLPVMLTARDAAHTGRLEPAASSLEVQDGVQSAQKTKFSNIKFTPGFFKIEASAPNMVLIPENEIIRNQAKLVINPAAPHTGSVKAGCDAAWAAVSGGKKIRGELSRSDVSDVDGGGKLMSIAAQFEPQGGAVAAVVVAEGKITRLTLTADTDLAFDLAITFLGSFFMSIEIARDQTPPGATSGAGAGPTIGPDPSESFDWDGPDRFEYGIYDHDCRDVQSEFDELVRNNDKLVSSVRPRTVTYANALNAARLVLQDPQAKKQYDHAIGYGSREYPKVFIASAVARLIDGDPLGALAHCLAGVTESSSDPTILYALAAILATVNMPNESLAVLKHLASLNKKPGMAVGIDPDVAVSYLTGYNEMIRGNLAEASAKLKSVVSADPFLNEASHCLALIAATQGRNGLPTFRNGLFRFKVRKTVFCVDAQTQVLRPSVDEMFDCSKGVPGILTDFRHPAGMSYFLGFSKTMEKLIKRASEEVSSRGSAMTANPWPLPTSPQPYDAWAEKMAGLIEGLDENEPLILKLQKDMDQSREAFREASEIHYKRLMNRINEMVVSEKKHLCPDIRDAANRAMNAMRPYIVHLDTMHRRHAKTKYRMMTGLLSYFGPGKWRDAVHASVRAELATLDAAFLGEMFLCYGAIMAAAEGMEEQCLEDNPGTGTWQASQDGPSCPSGLKDAGFKYSLGLPNDGPKVGIKVECKGMTFDVDFPFLKAKAPSGLAEYGLGGFAQVEMEWGGNWSVFMGAKGSLHVAGVGGQEKAGIYVKGSVADGATEMGGRVSFEGQAKAGDYTISQKGDSMDFTVIPAPKAAKLGPGLKAFRNQEPSTNAIFSRLRAIQPSSCCSMN